MSQIRRHTFQLTEVLVYMLAFSLIMGIVLLKGGDLIQADRHFGRVQKQLHQSLVIGETWRKEMRHHQKVELVSDSEIKVLSNEGESVHYSYRDQALWKKRGIGDWVLLLDEVKACQFRKEKRTYSKVWHWEFELHKKKKSSSIDPIFCFRTGHALK